jgi:molecular chaperone GrpE
MKNNTINMDPKEKETLNEEQLNTEETMDCTDAPQEEAAATDTNQNQGEETPDLSVEEELARQLEEANATIEEQKDKYLRLSAEFDNTAKEHSKRKPS